MLNEVKHLAVLGKIQLKLRETLRFAQGDKIFNTLATSRFSAIAKSIPQLE